MAGIGWVIVGGESGFGFRPPELDWIREIRDLCVATAVPFFFKQWGGRYPTVGGRILDGRTWNELPEQPLLPRGKVNPRTRVPKVRRESQTVVPT